MISEFRLSQLQAMIAAGKANGFYDWPEWEKVRDEVLRLDNWECQLCKRRHRFRQAALVHHMKHLKARPDLALSVFDEETGERQLLSVCRSCHEEQHPERIRRKTFVPAPPLTPERWD